MTTELYSIPLLKAKLLMSRTWLEIRQKGTHTDASLKCNQTNLMASLLNSV